MSNLVSMLENLCTVEDRLQGFVLLLSMATRMQDLRRTSSLPAGARNGASLSCGACGERKSRCRQWITLQPAFVSEATATGGERHYMNKMLLPSCTEYAREGSGAAPDPDVFAGTGEVYSSTTRYRRSTVRKESELWRSRHEDVSESPER